MAHSSLYITPEIKLSVYTDSFSTENVVFADHILIWFIEGETKIITPTQTLTFTPGDIYLFPRNAVAAVFNMPQSGKPNQAVVMHLTVQRLMAYYKDREINAETANDKIFRFRSHPLLQSCLASLIPYFEIGEQLPAEIADIKIHEAITILRTLDPGIDSVLANFEEPGKILLSGFMEKHYMFNMAMEKFGYLTGRSLTTFRRDFKKAYGTTPQKWLTQKRLELAHHYIKNNRRPVDVYLEVGFENLSHFSYAFKKQFGVVPSEVV
jgi:AraC family transcriptional regulator, exoenzyme S synthesis regulatory protein ExsA